MDYNKTRYGIVTLSLENLIQINTDFKELLIFVRSIDSQNISIELLKHFKPSMIVEKFVHNLRKYSFVTCEIKARDVSLISIHKSIQGVFF